MATASSNQDRLSFRVKREHKRLIEQAAASLGQSVSDFAVASMLRAAREAIQQEATTRLTARDFATFVELLEADREPNEALKRAAARYKSRRA